MPRSFSRAEKLAVIKWVDDHPDVPVHEAAKILKVEKNTLYSWNSTDGRKKILNATADEIVRLEAESPSTPPSEAAKTIAELRARVVALEKLVNIYKSMAGMP